MEICWLKGYSRGALHTKQTLWYGVSVYSHAFEIDNDKTYRDEAERIEDNGSVRKDPYVLCIVCCRPRFSEIEIVYKLLLISAQGSVQW